MSRNKIREVTEWANIFFANKTAISPSDDYQLHLSRIVHKSNVSKYTLVQQSSLSGREGKTSLKIHQSE